ncbi:MAG: hypothetical protein COB53_11335 [Elusimicrobia bacterium]|nr:MAG: hypothetical protein COB53_11335 [Elusimicrobiota bacterium]
MTKILMTMILSLMLPIGVFSHDGESHAQPDIAVVSLATEGLIAEFAENESVELALKHTPLVPGQLSEWTIYLSDYETNAPIKNASLVLSIRGQKDSNVEATATKVPGVYAAKLLFSEMGEHSVIVQISSEELDEILTLDSVQVGLSKAHRHASRGGPKKIVFAVGFAGLLAGIFLVWRRSRALKAASVFAAVVLGATTVYSHGGEDHGEGSFGGSEAAAVGQPIHMSKESQFLLGVRTVLVESSVLKKRVKTLGKVVARREGKADIYPPRSGRIIAHDVHYRVPRIGSRVKAGQIVAEIQTVSSYHVKTPISGVVIELNFAVGEQVDVSRKLLTILDPSVLWVEASIFESDLRAVEDSREAVISSSVYPEETFRGKLVALSAVFDEATRSVKAIFEFPNTDERLRPGMFVDVSIEAEAKEEALAVPSAAVLDKEGMRVVFVHTHVEEFEMREVHLGGRYGNLISIRSGVAEDERVVTVGAYQLLTAPNRGK